MEQLEQLWDEILKYMKNEYEFSDTLYNIWIAPMRVRAVENNRVYVHVKDQDVTAALSFLQRKFYLPLKASIAEITGIAYEVEFVAEDQVRPQFPVHPKTPAISEAAERSNLNPSYTFETFVVGNNNRFAHSAAIAVSESIIGATAFNPLFIYGRSGLGKTHLMQSIAHYILDHQPELNVVYTPSEAFTNEVIEAIRSGQHAAITRLREKYRSADVLLIDDIQFIHDKQSTQEEFFNAFNELHTAKKQIVISSDRPPQEMVSLNDRYRSRFEWGLQADIGSPDYETRMAILRQKVAQVDQTGLLISDEILNYIAINVKSNIRELEGALNRLIAYANLVKTEITMEIAVRELQNIISPDRAREISPQLILEVVAEHCHITVDQLMSKSRKSDIAEPRQIAMYLCQNIIGDTTTAIGKFLGGRDHSTVIHGIQKVTDKINSDEDFKNTVETIRKKINPN